MGSALRRSHRAWLLKVGFVLAMCFAAGLVTAGVVSGAGPLSILSTDTETTTASETTEETTTDGTETGTEPSETEPTETEPTEPTPTETEPTEPTTTEPAPTTPPTDPSIAADKEDYVPEEWVALLGEGWQPGESVHVFVNDDEGQTWSHHTDVTADELGAFETYLQLPSWFVATYSVTATGASGAVETTSFADSVAVDGSSTNSSGGSGPGSQQIALSAPAVSTGDVLVVQIVIADAISNTFICPATGSGWATIRKNSNSSNTILQETFWLRAAAASGIASHTFAFRTSSCSGALIGTGTKGASGGVVRFTGVVASGDPVDISAPTPNSGSSSGPFTAPNVITSVPNTHILRFFGAFKNITINPSSGRIYHVASSATKERTAAGFDGGLKATAGGAGTGTFTASFSSSAEFVSQTVALKPGVAVVSDAPVVNSPICAGATSVSGTSTEANGTSIEVFKGVTSLGTTTVTGGVWTKTGLPALAAGDAIKARATATGETVSVDSNVVTVVSCNAAPAAPANPAQFRSNGTTAIALGGFTNEPTVVLKGDVSDPDTNDSVKLEVEVKPVGTPFDGTGLVAGSNVTEPATASANVSGLANGGYHWRARAVDDDSASGGWTSFGPNAETDADFTVDTVKPILTASATSPPPGPAYAAGTWTNDDVKVAFDCQDPGSGVGTDTVPDVTVTTEGANQSVTSTGICADNAGNQADPATFSDIDIDKTAPLVNCGAADGNWHATDVSIACTAGDGALSGLASSGDAAFSLTTSVPAGTETANAATDSRVVSDNAGNSTTAGPIGGNKVDKKDPAVTCTVPDQSAWYGANVSVACTASDGGSGLANAADASFSLTTTVAAGAEDATASTGSHTVADGVGNDDTVGPYVFKVDRKDPTVSCTVPDQSVWYAANVTVNCTASDSGSGLANAADASFSLTTTVPAGTEDATASTGSQTVADGVGNDDNVGPYVFKVDRKDPTVSCTVPDQSVWYAANVTVNCTASDSGSGLANASDASFTLQTSVPAGSEDATASTGTHTVADTAGNDDTVGPYVFKVDRKAPQLSGCDAADGNWHADDVTLECTYTDGGSGPASQQVSLSTDVPAGTETANAAASADGAQACDAVSNCAASPADIGGNKVDKKDPAVTCTVPDQSVWYGANVSVACTASDGGSGLANAADASFSLTTTVPAGAEDATASTGSHTVADGVGNDDTVGPYVFKVDRKDPTVSCTVPDQSVWYAANVTVNCTASDSGSGLANAADASFSLTTTVPAGTEDATASTGSHTVADGVGNDDTVGPYVFKVDRRAPSVLCGSADGAWHSTDVSIACTASDGGSGLGSGSDASFNLTTSVPAGTETSGASTGTRVVADAVGNSTTAGPVTGNKVDKKGPVVTLSCASTVVLGSSATASWTAADGGSGVKPGYGSGTIALDTSSIGPKTATAPAGTSQDNVDNLSPAASCGYSVVFDFEGFFQPVDNGGVLNVVQAGRAIPLKFSLGGNQGLNIFATLYPKSTVIPCDGSSGTDVLEETMTAGSSSLQYDAGSDQYHYVWKTEKTWASSCRRLDLKFVDGTIRSALFNFKK